MYNIVLKIKHIKLYQINLNEGISPINTRRHKMYTKSIKRLYYDIHQRVLIKLDFPENDFDWIGLSSLTQMSAIEKLDSTEIIW